MWIHTLSKMINQDFKAQGPKYQVIPNLGSPVELVEAHCYELPHMHVQFLLCLPAIRRQKHYLPLPREELLPSSKHPSLPS